MSVHFLSELIFIIAAAFIGGFIARSLKLPAILGYIGSGVVFGIFGGALSSKEVLAELSRIGVSLLLFTLGFEFSFETLKRVGRKVFLVGIIQVIGVALILVPALLLFRLPFATSIFLACIFTFSSTAVIVKILEEKELIHDFPGNNIFIFLLIQDLFVVPVIFLLPILFASSNLIDINPTGVFYSIGKSILIIGAIFLLNKFLLKRFLALLFRYPSHELTILGTIFIAGLSIWLLGILGVPESIAAFLAGILVSEQGKNFSPLSEIRPIRDVLLVLFFVTTGMLLNTAYFIDHLPFIVSTVGVVLVLKFLTLYGVLRLSGYIPQAAGFSASYLTNIGEFAAVIGQLALLQGYITTGDFNLLLSVFIISLLLTPLWTQSFVGIGGKLGKLKILSRLNLDRASTISAVPAKHMKGHVIICGHGRVGRNITRLLDLTDISYIVVDFDKRVVASLLQSNKQALYGDPTDPALLETAFIKDAKVLVIALPEGNVQKKIARAALAANPSLVIITRSHTEKDRVDLVNIGVSTVILPEFEAGVKMGNLLLKTFHVDPDELASLEKYLRGMHVV